MPDVRTNDHVPTSKIITDISTLQCKHLPLYIIKDRALYGIVFNLPETQLSNEFVKGS